MTGSTPERLRIGITGARGFLGNRLGEILLRAHHWVHCFSRDPSTPFPACTEIRPMQKGVPPDVKGLDAVVHLAGENIFGLWTPAKKRAILESRREGTRLLVDSMIRARETDPENAPDTLISASATGYYGDKGEMILTEASPRGSGFLADVTHAWETDAFRAESAGIRVVVLRFGLLLGEEGGMLAKIRPLILAGLGTRLGSEEWIAWMHVEDAANLILFCIQNSAVHGVINAVSPEPVRSRDFYDALAKRYHRKIHFSIPASWIKRFGGSFGQSMMVSNRVTSSVIPTLEFTYQHPTL